MKYLKLLNLLLLFVLCCSLTTQAQCVIENLTVEFDEACNDNGTYNAVLNIEAINPTNDFYDLWVNNEFYGYFPVEDAPFSLENITPRFNSEYDIVQVCINDNPDCCAVLEYEQPVCDECEFVIYELNTFNCSAVGVYDLQFLLNEQEFDATTFDLFVNGELLYGNEPINTYNAYPITNSNQGVDVVQFCVAGTDCCTTIDLEAPDCDCNIINEVIFEETICDGGLTYYQINLDYIENGSETFELTLGNIFQFSETQTYAYTDLPVIVGPVEAQLYNNNTVIYIKDETGQCTGSGSLGFEPCEPTSDCTIINAITLPPMCNGNGTYNMNISISQLNPGNDGYSIYVDGELEGSYFYLNTFSLINNLTSDNGESHTIEIVDNQFSECSYIYEIPPVYCTDCAVTAIDIDDVICNDDGTYNAQLDVDIVNTTNEFIDVFVNNSFYGFFPIADLPLTLENITPRENSNEEHIQVCVNDNPDCCLEFEFPEPTCTDEMECTITNIVVEAHPCTPNGIFYVDIEVQGENFGNEGFSVVGNGNDYGDFSYEETFITLGPFEGDGETVLEFVIIDNENEDCQNFTGLDPIDCFVSDDCLVNNGTITNIDCNPNGTYNAVLGFEYLNASNDSFNLWVNNEYVGFYFLSDLPLLLENITPRANSNDEHIEICINDNPNCCYAFEYADPNCEITEPCNFTELIVETLECNDENQFMIIVDIAFEGTIAGSVALRGNGEEYGIYQVSDFPVELGPFGANTGVPYEILAYDTENETCAIETSFGQNCNDYVCYGFENQVLETVYNETNTIVNGIAFEMDDVAVLYNEFKNFDGTTELGNLEIQTTPVSFLENNTLYLNDASATFVFVNTALPVFQMTIDYWEASGAENIAVNGQSPLIVDHLGQLPTNILPNVTVVNEVFEVVGNSFYGRLTFTGDIQTILIGGQDLYLDNACIEYTLPPNPPMASNVWPGDANNDNIVNHFDVLNIGLAHGTQGEARSEQGNDWFSVSAFNWDESFADGTNYKYADCDGNGLVEDADLIGINENYGLLHDSEPVFESIESTENDPPFYVELPSANDFVEGQELQIPIILGSDDIPVGAIYGLAFTFKFSEGLFRNMDFEFNFNDGLMGDLTDVLTYNQSVFENNQIEVAITRKDQQNIALVNGNLGHFIGIIDDLAGMTQADVELINVVAIDVAENRIALNTPTVVVDLTTSTKQILLENAVDIFPNPAKDQLTIKNKHPQAIESIRVLNLMGQTVLEIAPTQDHIQLNVSDLSNGLYFLESNYDGAKNVQKFQVYR